MDPLAATSTAAAILQLAEFTGKVLSRSQELYKSAKGALVEHEELSSVTKMFDKLLTELRVGRDRQNNASKRLELHVVVDEAQVVTNELLELLRQLASVPGTSQRWKSIRQAVKTVWQEDKLRNLEKRVDRYREQVSLALMYDLRYASPFLDDGEV